MTPDIDPAGPSPARPMSRTANVCMRWLVLVFSGGICLAFVALGIYGLVVIGPDQFPLGGAVLVVVLGLTGFAITIAHFIGSGRPAPADEPAAGPVYRVDPAPSPADIPTTALPQGARLKSYRISLSDPHVLAMTPRANLYTAVAVAFAMGLTALISGLIVASVMAVIVGLLFCGVSVLIFLNITGHQFDRLADVYRTTTPLQRSAEMPLRSIRGVQLLTDIRREAEGRYMTYQYAAHQVNLILDESEIPRRLLVEGSDLEEFLKFGYLLADFLGVPLHRGKAFEGDGSA